MELIKYAIFIFLTVSIILSSVSLFFLWRMKEKLFIRNRSQTLTNFTANTGSNDLENGGAANLIRSFESRESTRRRIQENG